MKNAPLFIKVNIMKKILYIRCRSPFGLLLRLPVIIAIIVFISACASSTGGKNPNDVIKTGFLRHSPSTDNGDRYFYFLEAQLSKKRGNLDNSVSFLKKAIDKDPDSFFLRKELAAIYLRQQMPEKALGLMEAMLARNPDNIEALILYGKLKQSLKKNEEASEIYEKALKLDPKRKNIYLRLGPIYMEKGDYDNAFRVYSQLVKYFPKSYVGHFFLGKIYAEKGKLRKAEEKFRKTLELEPDLDEPHYELLNIYENQGKNRKTLKIYKKLLKDNPDNIRAAMGLGYFYHNIGMHGSSLKILSGLGKESLIKPEIIRTIIRLYIEKKKYKAASIILEGMLKGAPSSSDLHYIAGVAYDGLKNEKKMLKHLMKVRPDSRFYPNAVVHISFLYQEKNQIDKAIGFLEGVIKKVPDNPDFLKYLAIFYEDKKDYGKAEKTLKQGLAIDPDNIQLLFRLGVIYDKSSRKSECIDIMRKIIKLDPKNANALNYLGYTYADLGKNLDEAEKLIREALKYKPNDGYIIDSLGWVFFKRGDYKKALNYLKKAIGLVPDDPIILEHVGDAYNKLNDRKNALKYYNRSLFKRKKDDKKAMIKKIKELKKKHNKK